MTLVFNTCCTARSFDSPEWMEVYREFHRDLRMPDQSDLARPIPSIFGWYRNTIWRDHPERVGQAWCSAENVRETHKIWEYVQVLAGLYHGLPRLQGKQLLSLGAGIESPLWTLARWGADVTAADTYFERRYWHPDHVPHIRSRPEVFSPYPDPMPVRFINLNLKLRSLRSVVGWARLGKFDAIYSISSLEHVHGANRLGPPEGVPRIFARKLRMFRRIAGHLRPGGMFAFTTELITECGARRRLDYYTRPEIERIIEELERCGLRLLGPIAWDTAAEQELITRSAPGCRHTALSLAFTSAA